MNLKWHFEGMEKMKNEKKKERAMGKCKPRNDELHQSFAKFKALIFCSASSASSCYHNELWRWNKI